MEAIDQIVREEGVTDFTGTNYDEDQNHKIRISNGINIRDLREEGIVFQPEIPDEKQWNEERDEQREYFSRFGEQLVEQEEQRGEEGGLEAEFDVVKRDMVDVTEGKDGGVLKKVVREGHQTEGQVSFHLVRLIISADPT